jgi:SOS-response transcriptional repressor LexA
MLNNERMSTVEENRRQRLILLQKEFGTQVALAEKIGKSPAQISQWKNASKYSGSEKRRAMDRSTARHIEKMTGKPEGWLDQPIQQAQPSLEQDLKDSGFTLIQTYPIRVVHWGDIEKYLSGDVSVATRTIPSTLNEEGLFAIVLEDSDDSMEPEFPGGAILVVNPNRKPKSGSFVLARAQAGGALTLKQLMIDADQTYLKPVNKRYPIIQASDLVVEAVARQHVMVRELDD